MATLQFRLREPDFSDSYDRAIVELMTRAAGKRKPAKSIRLVSHPLARVVQNCGTAHIYTDTADKEELYDLLVRKEDSEHIYLYGEVDGNTTNQPLVVKVLDRFLGGDKTDNMVTWIEMLQRGKADLSIDEAAMLIYSVINGRLGLQVIDYYAGGRIWQISLELHTSLAPYRVASMGIARCLSRAVPNSFVKIAFTPDYPHALLIARDLENQGVPVNFTTTFSARQIVAAALLANPHRTNIFLGRLNDGLGAALLGEQVALESQRQIRWLRENPKTHIQTLNIVASVRRWQTIVLTAGCDVYTVPYPVLKQFFTQSDVAPKDIKSRLKTDYSDQLAISDQVIEKVGLEKIRQLYRVEPEFIEFLIELRESPEFVTIDGEGLFKRFDEAGFGDFFYAPTASEWRELRKGKLPDLDSPLTQALRLDTLYSLLAIGDFINLQDRMDEKIRAQIRHLFK